MQITKTEGIGYLRRESADSGRPATSFRALFVLSGSKGVSPTVLRRQLGLSDEDFRALIGRLQTMYLVESVSELRGDSIVEYLRLTDDGLSALQQILEGMCELPETE